MTDTEFTYKVSGQTDEPEQRKSSIVFNKKKYAAVQQELEQVAKEFCLSSQILSAFNEAICKALAFDPNVPVYTKEQQEKMRAAYKQRLAENNMTSWEAYGRTYYEKHRGECIEKINTCRKNRKQKSKLDSISVDCELLQAV